MKSKVFLSVLGLAVVVGLGITSYYTHRLWVWNFKVAKAFDYYEAAVECLIQEHGESEHDLEILFKGYKSRESWMKAAEKEFPGLYTDNDAETKERRDRLLKREMYSEQIPECKTFFSEYRCWELDIDNTKSLDGCGLHFGLLQSEIDAMKAEPDKKKRSVLSEAAWKRMTSKKDSK